MIQLITLHIIDKMLQVLMKQPDFFSQNEKKKKEMTEKLPSSIQDYLLQVSEEAFMNHLKESVKLIRSGNYSETSDSNQLLSALIHYISNEMATLMDLLPVEFYAMSIEEKRKFLEEKMKLPDVFVDIFSANSYQDIFENSYDFIKSIKRDFPYIVVQLARDPEAGIKTEMRRHFKEKFNEAFPKFQISKNLLGGMRILVDGKVVDQSWKGKIEKFTSQMTTNR